LSILKQGVPHTYNLYDNFFIRVMLVFNKSNVTSVDEIFKIFAGYIFLYNRDYFIKITLTVDGVLYSLFSLWRVAKRLPLRGRLAGIGSRRQVSDSKTDKDPTPPPRGTPGQQNIRVFWLSG
jgi:hypothetical protein